MQGNVMDLNILLHNIWYTWLFLTRQKKISSFFFFFFSLGVSAGEEQQWDGIAEAGIFCSLQQLC